MYNHRSGLPVIVLLRREWNLISHVQIFVFCPRAIILILLGRPPFLSPLFPITGYLVIPGLVNLEQLLTLAMAAVTGQKLQTVTARARGGKEVRGWNLVTQQENLNLIYQSIYKVCLEDRHFNFKLCRRDFGVFIRF